MRLIDADKYKQTLEYWIADIESTYDKEANAECRVILDCICQLDDAPTIDAVPVIRCQNCKHFAEFRAEAKKDGADGTCRRLIMKVVENEFSSVKATDFCSYGERKEGADNG